MSTFDPAATDEQISKSERKRRAEQRQTLGRELTELKAHDLGQLPIPDDLRRAIDDYQRFPSHGARRRQLQLIGRMMRSLELEPLLLALDTLRGQSAGARYAFHQVESWRERLLDEPDALTAFMSEHPETDVQQLRHHVQQVKSAKNAERERTAYRNLFRFLRDAVHPV
jgi:ribosome-associated protein